MYQVKYVTQLTDTVSMKSFRTAIAGVFDVIEEAEVRMTDGRLVINFETKKSSSIDEFLEVVGELKSRIEIFDVLS